MRGMNAEIIAVGTEILLGQIVNTNAAYLSRKLAQIGINVYCHSTVGDNYGRLLMALDIGLSRSDIVITTGGLGPTVDDITLSVIAIAAYRKLEKNNELLNDIRKYFLRKGIKSMPKCAERQAYVPVNSTWFKNELGTAPGIFIKHNNKIIIALPGPPRELEPMFEDYVIPHMRKNGYIKDETIITRTIKTTGLVESAVNSKVRDLLLLSGDVTVGIYAHLGEVHLKITAKMRLNRDKKGLIRIEKEIRKRLSYYIYGVDSDSLEGVVGGLLIKKKKTLSIAESCTGGLVADRITNVSGSSSYFKMGVVAYSNEAKQNLLGVSNESLKKYGAVSAAIAKEMAEGVKKKAGTDVSLGITGIAGPTGGTKKKPVGLVYVSVIVGKKSKVREFRFTGTRQEIKHQTAIAALDMVRRVLEERWTKDEG